MPRWNVFSLWLFSLGGLLAPLVFIGAALAMPVARQDQFGDDLPEAALARMGTIRLRHGSVIHALAFSPDGKLLASGGGRQADWDVHLWDADTGKLVRLLGHDNTIKALAFSPNGRLLASVGGDYSLCVWEASTGRPLYRHGTDVWSMAFAPDDKSVTVGSKSGVICILDARTGRTLRRLHGGEQIVGSIAHSPDGKLLASVDHAEVVHLWDIDSGKVLHRWTVERDGENLAFSPDGKTLAVWGLSSTVHLYGVPSARSLGLLRPKAGDMIRAAAFSPDGHFFVTVDDMKAHLWDMATRKELPLAWDPGSSLRAAAFTPDGKRLALAGEDYCIRFWETATARECTPSSNGHRQPVCALAVSPEASWVASADKGDDGTIRIWDLDTGKQLRSLQAGDQVGALALSPRGDTLVSASLRTLRFWDAVSGQQRHQLVCHKLPLSTTPDYLSYSADGKHLLIHSYRKGACYFDLRQDKPSHELQAELEYVSLSPDGKTVAGVFFKQVQFWDLSTGRQRHDLEGHEGNLICIAFSPDGRLVATGGLDDSICLWDAKEGRLIRRFSTSRGGGYSIYSVAFSPDGKMLVTGATCGVVQLWEVETGKERRRFVGHRGIVNAVAFCRSGQAIVSASDDTSLLVWDVTGQLSHNASPRTALTPEQLKCLWIALSDADARKAYDALCTLAVSPSGVPAFLLSRIRSSFQQDRDQMKKWIAQLDDEQFAVRESASRKLEQLGDRAEPALRLALTCSSSLEQRRRVQKLLDHFHTFPPPDRILAFRTVELLERIGTREAREALQTIAKEAPGTLTRQNAEAALQRLTRKTCPSRK